MGLFGLFKKKTKYRSQNSYVLDEADRMQSAEIKRIRKEMKLTRERMQLEREKLELEKLQEELAYMRGEDYEEYEEDQEKDPFSEESLLSTILMPILKGKMSPPNNSPVAEASSLPQQRHLTQEEIAQMWQQLPKPAKKTLKKLEFSQVKTLVATHLGEISEESHKNIFDFIKAQ